MKKSLIALVLSTFTLTGCDCSYVHNNKLEVELYRECIQLLAQSRKGLLEYRTDDDEDYDEAIQECRNSAELISSQAVCKEEAK